ncbi:hypothetical protein JXH92_003673 [Salmonella enterica subsp. enterica serovar 4,[5],12:b:-]|nr:hypothetical protein [Salmonella enterica subsp. enterica serovar 4,[5],12:b:-]
MEIKLSAAKKAIILEQALHQRAESEDTRSLLMRRFVDSYLYVSNKLPSKTFEKEPNVPSNGYVEPIIANAVKAALPQLLDSFTNNEKLSCVFRSRGAMRDHQVEEIITNNVNRLFLNKFDGLTFLQNIIKECLIVGDAVSKTFLETKKHHDSETLTDWLEIADFMSNLEEGWTIDLPPEFGEQKKGNVKGFQWKIENVIAPDQNGKPQQQEVISIKGDIPLIKNENELKFDHIDVSDFWVDASGGHIPDKCRYACHRIRTTVGEGILMGFDEQKLISASEFYVLDELHLPDLYFSDVVGVNNAKNSKDDNFNSTDPYERKIAIYEHYLYSSQLDPKHETNLYQVTTTENELLRVEKIDVWPFDHAQIETVVGSWFGRSFTDIGKPFQDAISNMKRILFQVSKMSAYPSYQAVRGQFDRDSLQNISRAGSVIEVTQIGAVERFAALTLPDQFFNSLQELEQSANDSFVASLGSSDTGIAPGSPQIAAQTLAMSIFQESLKGAILSKTFARTFLAPLFNRIYEIIKAEGIILEDENGQPIKDLKLPSSGEFIVDVNTSGDDNAEVINLQQVIGFIGQMSQIQSPVINPQTLFNAADQMCKRFNLETTKYFVDPSQNIDEEAERKAKEQDLITSEVNKINLQKANADYQQIVAKTALINAQIEELIKDSHNNRVIKQHESLQRMQEIANNSQVKTTKNAIDQQNADTKRKAVNGEIVLAAAGHSADIRDINGVR